MINCVTSICVDNKKKIKKKLRKSSSTFFKWSYKIRGLITATNPKKNISKMTDFLELSGILLKASVST